MFVAKKNKTNKNKCCCCVIFFNVQRLFILNTAVPHAEYFLHTSTITCALKISALQHALLLKIFKVKCPQTESPHLRKAFAL